MFATPSLTAAHALFCNLLRFFFAFCGCFLRGMRRGRRSRRARKERGDWSVPTARVARSSPLRYAFCAHEKKNVLGLQGFVRSFAGEGGDGVEFCGAGGGVQTKEDADEHGEDECDGACLPAYDVGKGANVFYGEADDYA